jgi:hypothetical protein
LVALLTLLPLLTACDSYAEFTVVNTTGEAMTAGWSYTGCPRQNAPPPRLQESKPVAAQAEVSFDNVTASQAKCVMVTNATGSVRLYAPYQDYGRYVVQTDAGTPAGLGIAVDAPAPAGSGADDSNGTSTKTVPAALTYVLGFGLALGVIASLVITIGHHRAQRRPRRRRLRHAQRPPASRRAA